MAEVRLTGVGSAQTGIVEVSLDVADRELFVLTGAAGGGQSTILRWIAGLEPITRGDLLIGERRVNDVPPKDREVAMVFQSYALYPRMSVHDNMAFSLQLRNYPGLEIKKRVADAAGILGLASVLGSKPEHLTASQRLNVALGRAIVCQPKVLLLDEPLANLEPAVRGLARTELLQLHQRLQTTVIYATSDPAEAMIVGARVAVLAGGAVQQIDRPLTLYREPRNMAVAGFLGPAPMNLIRGRLSAHGERLLFKEINRGVIECSFAAEERPALPAYAGQDVILGLRPEDIALSRETPPAGDAVFQGLVDVAENVGAETTFQVQTGGHTVLCRSHAPVDPRDTGHRLRFQFNPGQAHFFDPATTNRIV